MAASLTQTDLATQRLTLLKRTLIETREQIDWLIAGQSADDAGSIVTTRVKINTHRLK